LISPLASSSNADTLSPAFRITSWASTPAIGFAAAYYPVPCLIDQIPVNVINHAGTTYPLDGGFVPPGLVQGFSPGLASSVPETGLDSHHALQNTEQDTGADIDLEFLLGLSDEASGWTDVGGIFGSLSESPLSSELELISWPTPEPTPPATSSLATSWTGNSPTAGALGNAQCTSSTFVRYPCPECPKTWDTRDKLKRHVKNCHEKKHLCPRPGCMMRFGTQEDLKRHVNTIRHGGTRKFRCPKCGKELSRKDFLRRHLRGVHELDLPKGRGGNLGSAIMGG
jgi:predicted RNA-binding Zn-ribbon protein involved in translation (DUF1610 family)